jgi:hypothetical protein
MIATSYDLLTYKASTAFTQSDKIILFFEAKIKKEKVEVIEKDKTDKNKKYQNLNFSGDFQNGRVQKFASLLCIF